MDNKTSSVAATLAEREATHGNFADHARITQALKLRMHAMPGWSALCADQCEALDMIAHKIGRVLAGNPNHIDHWHDIQGYAALVESGLKHDERLREANAQHVTAPPL